MRNWRIKALCLSAVFFVCFAAVFNLRAVKPVQSSFIQPGTSQQENCFSPVISDFQGQAVQFRNVLNFLTHLPVVTTKHHFNEYSADSKPAEKLRSSHSYRYICYAENRIIRLQPRDIIFPFHYFW